MTRCRQHAQELGGGVCAVCLRERLEALVAVRSAFFEHPPEAPWKPPSPPAVPRSASPYAPVCSWDPDFSANVRRGGCRRSRPALFYGTPLGGPSSSEAASFSIFSTLFGAGGQNSRSEKVADQGCAVSTPGPGSTSWLAALLPWQRKKHQQQHSSCLPAAESAENSAVMRRRRRRRGEISCGATAAGCPRRGKKKKAATRQDRGATARPSRRRTSCRGRCRRRSGRPWCHPPAGPWRGSPSASAPWSGPIRGRGTPGRRRRRRW
ncbi:unnamed protein product [Spirodela intermedia]|uniref:Uncharacterized protein n=1 Tax=Spirodela intermedia TaxID=51605 RepID=A0A7I8JUN5_SPIIN|nr:unnamed protein product [Spirodela intermedia]CAA6673804.1 unnamed protein product [Spirodela intermedia]